MIQFRHSSIFIMAVVLLALSGCNYNVTRGNSEENADIEKTGAEDIDFATVTRLVLQPKCLSCHSAATGSQGGVNLDNYDSVRARLSRIAYRTLEIKDMPPGRPLSDGLSQVLRTWIDAGAPESLIGPSSIQADPTLNQGTNNWAKVRDKIFAKKCFDCHSGDASAGALDLNSLQVAREKAASIFDRVIVRQDMPMAPYPALVPRERQVLLKWFDSGMPE